MRRIDRKSVGTICILGLAIAWTGTVAAQSVARVESATASLDRWLGEDENAQKWRAFLKSDELAAELKKGDQADRAVLQGILSVYSGDTAGLNRRRFVAVRQALGAWLPTLPELTAKDLPALARRSKKEYVATDAGAPELAKAKLVDAMAELDIFLRSRGPRREAQWKRDLGWADLEEQLADGQQPNLKVLGTVSRMYYQNQKDYERPQFLAVREAIDEYADTLLFATNPQVQEYYEKYLEDLATGLETFAEDPTTDGAIAVGEALGWVERFGQDPELVDAVRRVYSQPNLLLRFSETMLRTGVDQEVTENITIREDILGTSIRGSARMTGNVTLDLVSNDDIAAFDVVLSGRTYSNNVGRNGPVTLYSSGVTTVNGRKRLLLDEEGVGDQPARASCRTHSKINKICANCRLVRKIASSQARKTKPKVEAIASKRAAGRVAQNMNLQVGELLETLNEVFAEKFRKPLIRRGGFPEKMDFRSTEDSLNVSMVQAGRDLLGAPAPAPGLSDDHDIAVRFHESFIGNLSQLVLGGVTLTKERAIEISENLTGEVPEELESSDDDWAIRFASQRPVEIRVNDDSFTVWIRGTRFERGDSVIPKKMEISATYSVQKTPEGAKLTRQGDVQVDYVPVIKQGIEETAMKSFVKTKFSGLMKEEIVTTGMVLPGRWGDMGTMMLRQLSCDDGWAVMGWQQSVGEVAVVAKRD